MILPPVSTERLARQALSHLQRVVGLDTQSDEDSLTTPTTEGQRLLADDLAGFYKELGATVEQDDHANIIASWPGRGCYRDAAPLALLVHLDTARGTNAVSELALTEAWDGSAISFPANPSIQVSVENYPTTREYLDQRLVHGPGDAPFGLDDKLGLTHCMTLAWILSHHPEIPHPPLLLVGRPDEEVGRMEPLVGLADLLAERGVRHGYTVDGLLPFEVNIENFDAAGAQLQFSDGPEGSDVQGGPLWALHIGGVNTHGATAHAEGHRAAIRLASEIMARLEDEGLRQELVITGFVSDERRDCDGILYVRAPDAGRAAQRAGLERSLASVLKDVVEPHVCRGASWRMERAPQGECPGQPVSTRAVLAFVRDFLKSAPGFPIAAEESDGHEGYSQPFRVRPSGQGLRLDIRVRDFTPEALQARLDHIGSQAAGRADSVESTQQYENMGPRLVPHECLLLWPRAAGEALGLEVRERPIRGGTGVDPFLERGVFVANLGTGYFAPESEKEFTSLELMAKHALWLVALLQKAGELPAA